MQINQQLVVRMKTSAQKYVIGNWKLNPATLADAVALALQLKETLADMETRCVCVGVAPSVLYLTDVKKLLPLPVQLGVQDITHKTLDVGAFTGDVSAMQVGSMGANFTLVGHSERRQYYGENDEVLTAKIQHAFNANLSVVFCVGETKDEYEQGKTQEVLKKQLQLLMQFTKEIPDAKEAVFPKLIIAYEPVWAIGTGLTPTLGEIEKTHKFIGKLLSDFGMPVPILYGGSVNDKNASDIATCQGVDGVLVGGASLKIDSFATIVSAFDN